MCFSFGDATDVGGSAETEIFGFGYVATTTYTVRYLEVLGSTLIGGWGGSGLAHN